MSMLTSILSARAAFLEQAIILAVPPVVPSCSEADVTLWKLALGRALLAPAAVPFCWQFVSPDEAQVDSALCDTVSLLRAALPNPTPAVSAFLADLEADPVGVDWIPQLRCLLGPGTHPWLEQADQDFDYLAHSQLPNPQLTGKSAALAESQRPRIVFLVPSALREFSRQLQPIEHAPSQRSTAAEGRFVARGWPASSRVSVVGVHECPHLFDDRRHVEDYPEAHSLEVRGVIGDQHFDFLSSCPCRPERAPVAGTIFVHTPQFASVLPTLGFLSLPDSDEV